MTPPGAPTVVRVPRGRARPRRRPRRPDATRAGVPPRGHAAPRTWARSRSGGRVGGVLAPVQPGLETVERGKYRGRLVGNQAVRVPTAAVQAYARARRGRARAGARCPEPAAPRSRNQARAKAASKRGRAAEPLPPRPTPPRLPIRPLPRAACGEGQAGREPGGLAR
jgi:hypothetical protein